MLLCKSFHLHKPPLVLFFGDLFFIFHDGPLRLNYFNYFYHLLFLGAQRKPPFIHDSINTSCRTSEVGPPGSGKSTALKMMVAAQPADTAVVLLAHRSKARLELLG